MSSNYKLVFGIVVGAALGAAAMQGLQAQTKPKAYSISELETLDAAAADAFAPTADRNGSSRITVSSTYPSRSVGLKHLASRCRLEQ